MLRLKDNKPRKEISMPLKKLISDAHEVYKVSKGTQKVIEELTKLPEDQLSTALDKAQKTTTPGNSKNLIDLLVIIKQFQQNKKTADQALKEMNAVKLKFEKGSFWGIFSSGAYSEEYQKSYNDFIQVLEKEITPECANRIDSPLDFKEIYTPSKPIPIPTAESPRTVKYRSNVNELKNEIDELKEELAKQRKEKAILQIRLDKALSDLKLLLPPESELDLQQNEIDALADLLIVDIEFEKNCIDLIKIFGSDKELGKVCKEKFDYFSQKYAYFNKKTITKLMDADEKTIPMVGDKEKIEELKRLMPLDYFNHNKKELSFLRYPMFGTTKTNEKEPISQSSSPTQKSTVYLSKEALHKKKIIEFCDTILKYLNAIETNQIAKKAHCLGRIDKQKLILLESYARQKMQVDAHIAKTVSRYFTPLRLVL